MYNPTENDFNHIPQDNDTKHEPETSQPAAPGYGTGSAPYTSQTSSSSPSAGQAGPETSQPRPVAPVQAPASPSVTYHTGPVRTGSAYLPNQNASPYYGTSQGQQGPAPAQAPRTAYTWNPQGNAPAQQPASPYYAPVQPPKQKKAKKRGGGKFALKLLAAVLCCAVVSLGSVGAFAALIQNGVVNVVSKGEANQTAAFTIYKQAQDSAASTPTVTGESMTAQEIAQKLIPSVVCVQNYQITQQSDYFFGDFFGFDYDDYSDYDADDSGMSPAGEGSGIIISKDGYIVTNQHVIDGATRLKVVTSEGLSYEAELVGEDTQTDLAVIKINTEDELTPAEFGSSEDLEVADEVIAIGNPGGLQLNSSCTFGRVSALNRPISNSDTGYTMKCIQTDASINPGNSGGALVDMNGHVVGINSSKIVDTRYEGLGFAIPSDTVQPVVSDLIEYGYVKDRAAVGFSGEYIERLRASWYGMNPGYYITQVTSEEAEQAGLRRGDMITAIDDTQVTSSSTIDSYIMDKKPGDTVTLTVDRSLSNGEGTTVELVLSENTGRSAEGK